MVSKYHISRYLLSVKYSHANIRQTLALYCIICICVYRKGSSNRFTKKGKATYGCCVLECQSFKLATFSNPWTRTSLEIKRISLSLGLKGPQMGERPCIGHHKNNWIPKWLKPSLRQLSTLSRSDWDALGRDYLNPVVAATSTGCYRDVYGTKMRTLSSSISREINHIDMKVNTRVGVNIYCPGIM